MPSSVQRPAESRRQRTRSTSSSALLLLALGLTSLPGTAHADLLRKPLAIHPEDRFASPKFDIRIWNHLPIRESEAQAWLSGSKWQEHQDRNQAQASTEDRAKRQPDNVIELFRGKEAAFVPEAKHIADCVHRQSLQHPFSAEDTETAASLPLVRMKLPGAPSSILNANASSSSPTSDPVDDDYLCLLPSTGQSPVKDDADAEEDGQAQGQRAIDPPPSPEEAWSSLDHLHGACLFHRQGWFTYRYCHDQAIRQFREAPHKHPHPAGGYVPAEDENYDAYDLGLSPREALRRAEVARRKKAASGEDATPDHAIVETAPQAVQSSPIVQSRYLTQTWTDGTLCDKTGEPRMTEVQFHCKMNGVDEIAFIKEVSTCEYILVIHTPRLCNLPGFHVPSASDEPSRPITCRQIVPDAAHDQFLTQRLARIEDRERFLIGAHSGALSSVSGSIANPAAVLNPVQRHVFEERMRQVRVEGDRFPEGHYLALPGAQAQRPRVEAQKMTTNADAAAAAQEIAAAAPRFHHDQPSNENAAGQDGEDDDTELVEVEVILMDEEGNEVPFVASQRISRQGRAGDADLNEAEWQELEEGILDSAEDVIRGIIADMDVGGAGGAGLDVLDRQDWLRGLVERATLELQRHADGQQEQQQPAEDEIADNDQEERENRREL